MIFKFYLCDFFIDHFLIKKLKKKKTIDDSMQKMISKVQKWKF